ncbi:helix-turn-helix domain-containing protein [Reichenbachiella sp.]|uniref:helix-turn-helix domain-containing protein n=1 Tax=Reichenbachiella sp. TaxID=2184521 RepID=UPI003B5C06F2
MILIHDLSILFNTIFLGMSIFIAFLLWNQKTIYRQSNRMLSLLLVSIALITFNTIVRLSYYMEQMDFYQHISNAALLLMGPAIYLFINIRVSVKKMNKWVFHFLPFCFYVLIFLSHLICSFPEKIDLVDQFAFIAFVVQWVTYLGLSYYLVDRYQNQTKQSFSNLDNHDFKWIRVVIVLLLSTLLLRIGLLVYSNLVEKTLDVIGLNLTLVFAIITCYLGFNIFKKPELFVKLDSYAQSKLSVTDLQLNKEKIEKVMINQSLFTNPKLTINELADKVGLHSRIVSQTLNQEVNQNFFDFVNSYRVQNLIEKLKSPDAKSYTLQALMEESGFQSPSVAYAAFKKVTGTTPARFRETIVSIE